MPSELLARSSGQSISDLDVSGRQQGWLVWELEMKSLGGGTGNAMGTPYFLHNTVFQNRASEGYSGVTNSTVSFLLMKSLMR